MLDLVLLAILSQSINADVADRDASPFVVDDAPRPAIEFNTDAMESSMVSAAAKEPAKPVMFSATWCANCPGWAKYFGSAVDVVSVSSMPNGGPAPAFQRADGAYWDWATQGIPTRESFDAWAALGVPVAAPASVGSVDLSQIEQYISLIDGGELKGRLPPQKIPLSSSLVFDPRGSKWVLRIDPQIKSVAFSEPLPSVSWSAFRVDVEGVELADGKVRVKLKRFPDWTLDVR
jgi:hypothetical protein